MSDTGLQDARPDLQPGFWPEYREPATRLATAMQYPISEPSFVPRVISAYVNDAREASALLRRAAKIAQSPNGGNHG